MVLKRSRHSTTRTVGTGLGQLVRRMVFAYPATQLLVETLQELHADGLAAPTLVTFLERLHSDRSSYAVERSSGAPTTSASGF